MRPAFKKVIAGIVGAVSVSLASILHGGDYAGKAILLVALAIIYAVLGYGLAQWLGAVAGIAATMLFWFTYRTGTQAKAELDKQFHVDSAENILLAYILPVLVSSIIIGVSSYFAGWVWVFLIIPCLLTPLAPYFMARKYVRGNGKSDRSNRLRVELVTPGAINSACVLIAVCEALRVW